MTVSSEDRSGVWATAREVLCVRLDTIGDVLMTGPAMRAVRSGDTRRITLLTSPAGGRIATLMPEVDDVIVYEAPWMKATAPRGTSDPEYRMADTIKEKGFDAAVIFTVYSQNPLPSALLCYLAGVPLRLAHCRENPYQLLTDWIAETEPERGVRHEVRRQIDLVSHVGFTIPDERLALDVPEGARRAMHEWVERNSFAGRRWIVVHPGASAQSRRYPPEMFAEAIKRLVVDGIEVVLTGSVEEVNYVMDIGRRSGVPTRSLAGELDLARLSALIEAAPLLVSSNTAPVHIASAVGTPVVDLYALTNPQHTPWKVPSQVLFHDVECRWCYSSVCKEGHHNCLRMVEPSAIVTAVRELLQHAPSQAALR